MSTVLVLEKVLAMTMSWTLEHGDVAAGEFIQSFLRVRIESTAVVLTINHMLCHCA